LREWEALEA
jgi:hypothetical protein